MKESATVTQPSVCTRKYWRSMTLAIPLVSVIFAINACVTYAADVLKGSVKLEHKNVKGSVCKTPQSHFDHELVDKYGPSANSVGVAAAIRKAESLPSVPIITNASGRDYSQRQNQIMTLQMRNQMLAEEAIRARLGPVFVPVLQPDHNWLAQHARRTPNGFVLDRNQVLRNEQASIREMVDASGNIVAQYSYDPYGQQMRIAGSGPDSDFGFAGYYVHQRSGLNMALFRNYSPSLGRWISRDPIQDPAFRLTYLLQNNAFRTYVGKNTPEVASLNFNLDPRFLPGGSVKMATLLANPFSNGAESNLYTYMANNPTSGSDPLGLFAQCSPPLSVAPGDGDVFVYCWNKCSSAKSFAEFARCLNACLRAGGFGGQR